MPAVPSIAARVAVDLALLVGWAVPHSLLLRPSGKRLLGRLVPKNVIPAAYGLIASLSLIAVVALWQELPGHLWSFEGWGGTVLLGVHAAGWALMATSMLLTGPLRQPGLGSLLDHLHGRRPRAYPLPRVGPFRFTRHPIYVAMLVMLWVTPSMTTGHLLAATVWTGYLVIGVAHKEKRLRRTLGEAWTRYVAAVPLLPGLRPHERPLPAETQARGRVASRAAPRDRVKTAA